MKTSIIALALTTIMTPAAAAPISFTGSELLNFTGISFPNGTPSLVGDSLRLNNPRTSGILAVLSLDDFLIDPNQFEVQINITKLLRDDGISDQDVNIFLSDGFNLFGGVFGDISSTTNTIAYHPARAEVSGDGLSFIYREFLDPSGFVPAVAGETFLATLSVQSTPSGTTINGNINEGVVEAGGSFSSFLDPSNGGLSLVFGADAVGENIQINSITFTRGISIPEPSTLTGLTTGMMLLFGALYRRRTPLAMPSSQSI